MSDDTTKLALAIAGGLFLIYLLVRLRVSLVPSTPEARAARALIAAAKRRARVPGASPESRATAWREAANAALEGLNQPSLAANFALRAERVAPADPGGVGILSRALRRAARYRALERLLWRRLDRQPEGEEREQTFAELLGLYEGPMRCPERARVLRSLGRLPDGLGRGLVHTPVSEPGLLNDGIPELDGDDESDFPE